MRSHPYAAPPPPLPPILDEPASLAPSLRSSRSQDDLDVPLVALDPETSQLLPVKKRKHRVRVQGHLAVVRSVSTTNLGAPSPGAATNSPSTGPSTPRFETGVGGRLEPQRPDGRGSDGSRRRRSLDDGGDSEMEEDDHRETAVRDRQFRGYGIGGAGNIRRPSNRRVRLVAVIQFAGVEAVRAAFTREPGFRQPREEVVEFAASHEQDE